MTASITHQNAESRDKLYLIDTTTAVAVATSGVTIGEFIPGRTTNVSITVTDAGASLTDFILQFQDSENSTAYNVISGTDWTTLAGTDLLPRITTQKPNDLADGETSSFEFNLPAVYKVLFKASSSVSNSTVKIQGTGRRE